MSYYVAIKQELRVQGWVNEVHKRTDFEPHPMREYRLVPTHRLMARLGLTEWEYQKAPLDETDYRPQRVSIPLRQHTGAPAQPVVGVGDRVAVGDRIAQIPGEALGANVHASLAGRISRVDGTAIEIVA
jgi:hypothetical protein